MGERVRPWRAWYQTSLWQSLRLTTFQRDGYRCRLCRQPTGNPVCDHIKAHRGDRRLFFDQANLQTLCKPCHDSAKKREESALFHTRGVWH